MEANSSIQESLLTAPNAEEETLGGDLKRRIFQESTKIWKIATPGVISRVGSFGTIVVTQAFFGHLSSVDLAAYALVQTLSFRLVNGVLLGMSSATETLCGQAFGAKQYHIEYLCAIEEIEFGEVLMPRQINSSSMVFNFDFL